MARLENPKLSIKILGDADIVIDDLEMSFEIVKDLGEEPNESTLYIHNLNEDTRGQITEAANKSAIVEIHASKSQSQDLIKMYVGELDYVRHTNTRPGYETEIICTSQQLNHRSKFVDLSFKSGTLKSDIVSKLIDEIGLPRGVVESIPAGGIKLGQQYSGAAYHSLQRFCLEYLDKYCYILDGTINITDIFEPEFILYKELDVDELLSDPQPTGRVDRGLVLASTLTDISVKKEFEDKKRKKRKKRKRIKVVGDTDPIEYEAVDTQIKGMDFGFMLQPDVNPDNLISVPTSSLNDRIFRVTEVVHSGNTAYFDDWNTDLVTDEYEDLGGAIGVTLA